MRYGGKFKDDGASFRVRRLLQLERDFRGSYRLPSTPQRRRTPAQKLILFAVLFNAPFAGALLVVICWAIATVIWEAIR